MHFFRGVRRVYVEKRHGWVDFTRSKGFLRDPCLGILSFVVYASGRNVAKEISNSSSTTVLSFLLKPHPTLVGSLGTRAGELRRGVSQIV